MTVARLAISLDAALARQVRRAAGKEPVSSWFADAARRKLRSEGLLDVVREWEGVHSEITEAELRSVERKQQPKRKRK